MRIIGGDLRGRRLFSVSGLQTRPTADRLRESVFNILSESVQDSVVLDLFAGTGTLGLESLSRGAQKAVFVDKSKRVLSVIRRNIQSCGLETKAEVIRWDIIRNLNCLKTFEPAFNLVLMDPPYDRQIVSTTLNHLHRSGCLANEALVVVEHLFREKIETQASVYTLFDQRKYGKTLVSFLRYMV